MQRWQFPRRFLLRAMMVGWLMAASLCGETSFNLSAAAAEPWAENPWYWSHAGQPVLLLGGSDDDNLFQWPAEKLLPQLDRIRAAGGNFVRNTMSDRKDAGFEVYPFAKLDDGRYDLEQWNPEYWERFERFLRETSQRGIFVQIEVWDRFDYTDNRANDPRRWEDHPYNPPNNVNYSAAETGLQLRYPEHPGANKQAFFFSTPAQRNIEPLLKIQTAFVNRLLDFSLQHDHVLYCIDNETRAEPAWGRHWAKLIQSRAAAVEKTVPVTEMWDDWDLTAATHRETFDHPELYSFVDISQNNHNSGWQHWERAQFVRQLLSDTPRPINTTKTYGADGNKFGHTNQDAIERFWRHLLGGVAAVRFHRPDSGLGINDQAVHCIRAARRVEAAVPFWNLTPAIDILTDREANEAYAAATVDRATIVAFFPRQQTLASVGLVDSLAKHRWQIVWVDVDRGNSTKQQHVDPQTAIVPPADGNFVAIMKRLDATMLGGEVMKVRGAANDQEWTGFVCLPAPELRKSPQPWVMYAPTLLPNYPDEHERWLHGQLLAAGIAIAGVDVGEAYGSPRGVLAMNALYDQLTTRREFSKRVSLLGRSRGGLWVSSWAAENPDKVSAIAGIYPVFDLTTYPGIPAAAAAYDLTAAELQAELSQVNPIAKATRLAEQAIPCFIIHGNEDAVVPIEPNSLALQRLYQTAGQAAAIEVLPIAGQGHNYWPGFFRCQQLVDFLIEHSQEE